MFIRFVIDTKDGDSGKRKGIFQVIFEQQKENLLFDYESKRIKKLFKWFDDNLSKPTTFSKSTRFNKKAIAISWYKSTANVHISNMREPFCILENHGILVESIQTDNPGYIVYEDDYQVTAIPHKNTIT